MGSNKDLSEASLSELVKLISKIINKNKLIYLAILVLVTIGAAGVLVKGKLYPEYKAQILIGSEALNLPNLKIIVADINLEIEQSDAMLRFNQNPNVYESVDQLQFGEFKIAAADDKDKSINAYRLEFVFTEAKDDLNFNEISELVLNDIKNKGSVNVSIQEKKKELIRNIEDISISIANASATEEAIRQNIVEKNEDIGVIGLSEFYQDLNMLQASKNKLEKELFFLEKDNLVYKLTNHSFENHGNSKIELFAYTLFLFLFFSLIFTILKLIVE